MIISSVRYALIDTLLRGTAHVEEFEIRPVGGPEASSLGEGDWGIGGEVALEGGWDCSVGRFWNELGSGSELGR